MKLTKNYLKRLIKEEMRKKLREQKFTGKPQGYENDPTWKADQEEDDYDDSNPMIGELEEFQMKIENGEKVNHKELTKLLFKALKEDDDFVRRAAEDLQDAIENAPEDKYVGMKKKDRWNKDY